MSDRTDSAVVSADDELKRAQAAKLRREMELLPSTKWNLEILAKLAVAAIGVAAALFALWLDIPETKLKAADAQKKVIDAQKLVLDLERKALDEARQHEDLRASRKKEMQAAEDEFNMKLKALEAQIKASGATVTAAAVKPRVFIQFSGDLTRDTINQLRDKLNAGDFVAPEAERISGLKYRNQVRYFSDAPEERQRATKLATSVADFFAQKGCKLTEPIEARRVQSDGPSPLEIWVQHNCKS